MSLLRAAIARPLSRSFAPATMIRPLSTTSPCLSKSKTPPPPPNVPPSAKSAGRTDSVSDDPQSSASLKGPKKTGDDHPAKQPDPQPESESSTGFQEVKGGVQGGKEGLHHRTDKQ